MLLLALSLLAIVANADDKIKRSKIHAVKVHRGVESDLLKNLERHGQMAAAHNNNNNNARYGSRQEQQQQQQQNYEDGITNANTEEDGKTEREGNANGLRKIKTSNAKLFPYSYYEQQTTAERQQPQSTQASPYISGEIEGQTFEQENQEQQVNTNENINAVEQPPQQPEFNNQNNNGFGNGYPGVSSPQDPYNNLSYSNRQWEYIKKRGGFFSVNNGNSQYSTSLECDGYRGRYKRHHPRYKRCPGLRRALSGGGFSGGDDGGGMSCFSADMEVKLSNGEMRRMDELKVGDWIFTVNDTAVVYSRVDSWMHKLKSQPAEFLHIHLYGGKILKITPKHLIHKSRARCSGGCRKHPIKVEWIHANAPPTLAENVALGDCLFVMEDSLFYERQVKKIDIVVEQGIFSPMTGTGNIIVQDVLASCYSIEPSFVLQNTVFRPSLMRDSMLGNLIGVEEEIDLPPWMHLLVDYMLPAIIPSK